MRSMAHKKNHFIVLFHVLLIHWNIYFRMNGALSWKFIQYFKRYRYFVHVLCWSALSFTLFVCLIYIWSFFYGITGLFGEDFEETRNWCICWSIKSTSGYICFSAFTFLGVAYTAFVVVREYYICVFFARAFLDVFILLLLLLENIITKW